MAYEVDMGQAKLDWAWIESHNAAVIGYAADHPHRIDSIIAHLVACGLIRMDQLFDEKLQAAFVAVFAYGMIAQRDGWPEKEAD